jgi:hypothetical protein
VGVGVTSGVESLLVKRENPPMISPTTINPPTTLPPEDEVEDELMLDELDSLSPHDLTQIYCAPG